MAQPAFSAGVEGAIGLSRIITITGHYAFDHLNFDDLRSPVHEFMAGFRLSVPNHSRITPFGAVSAGSATLPMFNFINGTLAVPTPITHFALAIGPGVNYRISLRTGIFLDVRGVAISFGFDTRPGWFVRTTGGFYFRF